MDVHLVYEKSISKGNMCVDQNPCFNLTRQNVSLPILYLSIPDILYIASS